jgi:hypothetical protein
LVLAAAGCGFSHGALQPSGDDDGIADDAAIDGPLTDARIDSPAPVICNAADLDLRSCFTFDGSVSEGSSYSHGTSVANVTFVTGHDNQAVAIQSGSNITITGNASSFDVTTFTIRMWIKPASLPAASTRMGLVDSGNRYRMFLLPGGALRCALTGGPDLISATGLVSAGAWQRVACTFDGTFTRIYVNGVKKAELMQTATVGTSTGGIVIGQNNPSGENLDGAMDSFQLWGSIVAP